MSDLLKEAIREYFGERCPDFDPGCPCCRVWAEIDEISRLCAQNAELLKALQRFACTCDRVGNAECSSGEVDCPFWNARAAIAKVTKSGE